MCRSTHRCLPAPSRSLLNVHASSLCSAASWKTSSCLHQYTSPCLLHPAPAELQCYHDRLQDMRQDKCSNNINKIVLIIGYYMMGPHAHKHLSNAVQHDRFTLLQYNRTSTVQLERYKKYRQLVHTRQAYPDSFPARSSFRYFFSEITRPLYSPGKVEIRGKNNGTIQTYQ